LLAFVDPVGDYGDKKYQARYTSVKPIVYKKPPERPADEVITPKLRRCMTQQYGETSEKDCRPNASQSAFALEFRAHRDCLSSFRAGVSALFSAYEQLLLRLTLGKPPAGADTSSNYIVRSDERQRG